ncbi:hypothetical protein O6H91_09G037200 [Diphasiastrum complanatum]|uniref:Uncharacterized protein n=1 Tax=Diphasiastrum complanatum TaxID=34168 RepID=A0ACC2CN25_DIPCM|nr:hypothetical protein O6H91_09G037200 [Diphasiastrum complanatum]
MSAKKPIILITSGISKTGAAVAKQLLAARGNCSVRVGSRDPNKLSALSAEGAEVVLIDETVSTAIAAFTGVHAAFIVLPSLVGGLEAELLETFLHAAKQTGVKHIVYLSAVDAEIGNTVHKHYHYEQLLIKSCLSFTILRPTYFHENVINYHAASIKDGVVAVHDIAAVAAAALADPLRHTGQIYTLTTEAVMDSQVAEKLSKVLGKQVSHVNVTPEEHLKILTQKYDRTRGAAFAAGLVDLDKNKRLSRWSVVDPALERVLGHKGISLEQFFTVNASSFN